MKKIVLLIIFCLTSIKATAFDDLLFRPLTANTFEPRVGAIIEADDEKLRLDIGSSIDLTEFNPSENIAMRLGADFFTYTRLRSQSNFKFPVETSDYFFGINASMLMKQENYNIGARVRIAHISSHLVDGYTGKDYVFTQMPFVYSREFLDIVFSYERSFIVDKIRVYAGNNFIFSTRPKNVAKLVPQLGLDFEQKLYDFVSLDGGIDWKLAGSHGKTESQKAVQLGLMFHTSKGSGLLLSYYHYSGASIHGMFYDKTDNYNGIGFQVIFWNS